MSSFGFAPLPGIDPNPVNFVAAAILHMDAQVGCLLRIEPSAELQVRSSYTISCIE
jgi:AP-2 complex subunit alpha